MDKGARIFVAGHRGLVGSAIVRTLQAAGYRNLITRTSAELDLREQGATRAFFEKERPEYVFIAAAKVGGIVANNSYPAEFIYDNLMIQNNVIHASYLSGVQKLLLLGSTCIYPKLAPQPIREDALLTGPLEPTNEPYAIAKIAGIKMCQSYNRQYGTRYICAMPTNLYGPNDNFDLTTSHVLPAFIRKFHEAKASGAENVVIWGSGTPYREFVHVDDVAEASLFLMENYEGWEPVNIGSGEELTIRALAEQVAAVVGFKGGLVFDASKPDGTPRKLSDVSRIHELGWRHRITLEEGLNSTYAWYLENQGGGVRG
ncbi:GDP-L-fucose synthase [Geomesophilobacter sediminis]|uniref:GDP-L-fucose synthase n=1 Tax=Geomesophilobacter sediminis TaxID=2798584 RepID=A0A8J7JGK0_9BACT|nr:GDP-L-fucose synthase [Geomesophilobacter sediminis]MBJ6725934.1 GDP-L-fucose synthase [Geomesophilobacter sediminis]